MIREQALEHCSICFGDSRLQLTQIPSWAS